MFEKTVPTEKDLSDSVTLELANDDGRERNHVELIVIIKNLNVQNSIWLLYYLFDNTMYNLLCHKQSN